MTIKSYKTKKVVAGDSLEKILDESLPELSENQIVVVTSKIVAICQGDIVRIDGTTDKHELAKKQVEYYIDEPLASRYPLLLTIERGFLIANGGVDESNGNGYFVLWPKNPDEAAANIWMYLRKKYSLKHLGIIITDSRTTPLRWGTLGIGLAYCGFEPLKDYIGTTDIFGTYKLKMTKLSILDGLSAAAVIVMGEGNEQTPVAVISDTPNVTFTDHPPTQKELTDFRISLEDDMYAALTNSSKWKPGGKKNKSGKDE